MGRAKAVVRVQLSESMARFSSLLLTVRRSVRQHIAHGGVSSAHRGVLLGVGTGRRGAPPARPVGPPRAAQYDGSTNSWYSRSMMPSRASASGPRSACAKAAGIRAERHSPLVHGDTPT